MISTAQTHLVAGDRFVPWLDQMPSGWSFLPLKYLVHINYRTLGEETDPETHIDYIDISSVDSDGLVAETSELAFGAAPSRARRVLISGDTFISTVRTYLTAIAFCDVRTNGCICSTGFAVLTPGSRVVPRFLFYWAKASSFVGEVVARSTGVSYPAINASEIGNLPFPLLALDYQQIIADYLDRKTTEIDALITRKRSMIDLLHEKRQALISEVVTKGLDPGVPMKDSGTEWMDFLPIHWSVERLKYSTTRIEQGWSPQCESRPADPEEWGVLKVGCVNGEDFNPEEQKALPSVLEPIEAYEIRPGDILMSRGNTRELVGSAALVKRVRPRLLLCDLLYRFRSNRRAEPEFLVHSLRSPHVRFQIEREATGTSSSMKKVGQETIRELLICLPPLPEQQAILQHLRPELDRVKSITKVIQEQIDKLREYRQTLISAAVTGRIDVTQEIK